MEGILPPRPRVEIPTGEDVEEVNLVDFDSTRGFGSSSSRNEAYGEDDDEEGQGNPQMRCATQ